MKQDNLVKNYLNSNGEVRLTPYILLENGSSFYELEDDSGADIIKTLKSIKLSDTISAIETITRKVRVKVFDSFSSVDSLLTVINVKIQDSILGLDNKLSTIKMKLSDIFSGIDTVVTVLVR